MKMKKSLAALIILSLFFTGCSNYQVAKNTAQVADEATKLQTMTKIQNDNNEIINKDYEYVISNLGEPNVTTYWTEKDEIKNIDDLDDVKNLTNVDLLYFKNVSNDEGKNNALFIQMEDNIVKKVQSIDYTKKEMLDDLYQDKVVIDCYRDYDTIKLSSLKSKNLKEFEDEEYHEIVNLVGDNHCIYDFYYYKDGIDQSIEVYALDNQEQILCVFSHGDTIKKVKIVNYNDVAREAKDILLQK